MKIAVFGATGMVGREVVAEAHLRGHIVTAISRTAKPDSAVGGLALRAVDLTNTEDLDTTLAELDAAVMTVRLALGCESQLASVTRSVLDAASRHSVRVLVVGGAAPLRTPNDPDRLLINDASYVPEEWKPIAQASVDQLRACQEHPYARWTYLSPPSVLEPGVRTGHYRRGTTTLLTNDNGDSRITTADLAVAVIDELEQPGNAQHFTIVSAPQPVDEV